MLESVVLICGHCQGLLLHLRITFDPPQRWTLISVALERQELERASMAKTAAKKTAKADDDTPVKQKRSKPKAAAK